MYFDNKFRTLIKQVSIEHRQTLIDDLIILLENEINHIPLEWYMEQEGTHIFLDKEKYKNSLEAMYSNSLLFVTDYEKEFYGGKEFIKYEGKEISKNDWDNYLIPLKNNFWSGMNPEEKNIYRELSSFDAFLDCEPRNTREKFQIINNEKYKIFNEKEWAKYYDRLMKYFFPDYRLNNKISNSTKKRYSHIDFDTKECVTSIYHNKGLLMSELKMGYLELRPMKIEILSTKINKYYRVEDYLVYNENIPIVELGLTQGFANLITDRIGYCDEEEEVLKKALYLHLNVYANYKNVILKYTNYVLDDICV